MSSFVLADYYRPAKRMNATSIAIGNDTNNARVIIKRRSQLFVKTGNIAELEKLPCISDIPKDMTIFEFDLIMRSLIENRISRSEYANVFSRTVRISIV
jgi:hypothetical protein